MSYFRPWWRKYGFVTLALACSVTGLWIQSTVRSGHIDLYPFRFRSADGIASLDFLNRDPMVTDLGSDFREIPYWSIILPLTILSFWLLLIKPQAANTAKPVEKAN